METISAELYEDKELLEQQTIEWAAAGDMRAMEGAFFLYGPVLRRRVAAKFGADKADDIVQGAFESAIASFNKKGGFEESCQNGMLKWLSRIAKNGGINDCRKKSNLRELPNEHMDDDTSWSAPASSQDVEKEVIDSMMVKELLSKLDQEDFLEALCRIGGLGESYQEYAEYSGKSVATSGTRLVRAKNMLREVAQKEDYV